MMCRTSASVWRSLQTDRTINSPALDVLGLKGPVGKTFRGDVGLALSDGVSRDGAHIYWPNKWRLHGRGCVAARPV